MGTFKQKLKSLILGLLLLAGMQVFAGAPTWVRVDYTSSTTFVGVVKILTYTPSFGYTPVAGDYIGAFVGNECRMVAQIFENGGQLYVSSVIQGGDIFNPPSASEEVSFKLWSDAGNREYSPIKGTTMTIPEGNIGSDTPYEIGKPNTGKDLLTLTVNGVTLSPTFATGTNAYTATVSTIPVTGDYTYTVSSRATVSITHATNLNGSASEKTTTITVTAEDGSTNIYTIVYSSTCSLTTAPTATAAQTSVCQGVTSLLTATGSAGVTFTWYADVNKNTQLGTGATYTATPTAPSTTYYVTQSTGASCVSPVGQVTVNATALPAVPGGSDKTICNGLATDLTATGTAGATFDWYTAETGGTAIFTGNPYVPTQAGTYYVSQTVSGCASATRKAIILVINTTPGAPTADDKSYCSADASKSLTVTGSTGATFAWYSSSDKTGGSIGSGATYTPTTAGTYYVAQTVSGCEGVTDAAVLTINASPATPVANDATFCSADATKSLTATGEASATFAWYSDAAKTNPSIGTGATFTPASAGTYYVAQSLAGCESATDAAVLTINTTPGAPTAEDKSYCSDATSKSLTATSANPAATFAWYADAAKSASPLATGASFSPADAGTYYVAQTVNGCEGSTDAAVLTLNSAPSVPTAPAVAVCQGESMTLTASSTNSNAVFKWYSDANKTTTLGSNATYTPAAAGVFYVSQTVNACESPLQQVTLTVNSLPSVSINSTVPAEACIDGSLITLAGTPALGTFTGDGVNNNEFDPSVGSGSHTILYTYTDGNGCTGTATKDIVVTSPDLPVGNNPSVVVGGTVPALTATGTLIKWYTDADVYITSGASYTPTVSTAAQATFTYKATNTVNGCESDFATVILTVTTCGVAAPTVDETIQTICAGESFVAFNATGTNLKWYNDAAPTVVVSTDAAFTPTAAGTYSVTQEDACVSAATKVTAQQNALPSVKLAASESTICAGEQISLTASGASTYAWDNSLPAGATQSVSPSADVTYNVTGTDANGCKNTATASIVVNDIPVVAVSASKTTICAGETVELTASGATSFAWDNGLGSAATATATPTQNITYSVVGTSDGCSATKTIDIVVNQIPELTIDAAPAVICAGSSSVLTASGATSYVWDNSLGTNAVVTVNPSANTTYSVTGTSNGCSASESVDISVSSGIDVAISASPASVCVGGSTTLTATGATSYAWSNSLPAGTTQTVSPTATTKYYVTGTQGSCSGVDSIVVDVNTVPTVTIAATKTEICAGESTTLTASGATSYQWNQGLTTAAEQVVTPTQSTIYSVVGSNNGCTATETISITVNQSPTVTTSGDVSVCNGTSKTITASGADTYVWSADLGSTASVSISPTSNVTYTVTGTSKGCTGTSSLAVTVFPAPTVRMTATDSSVCAGEATILTVTGAVQYVWDNGLTGGNTHTVNPKNTTFYNVTGTDANGCSGASRVIMNVTIPPLPTSKDTVIKVGDPIPALSAVGTIITWKDQSSTILSVGANYTPSISSTTAGVHTYQVTNTVDGCESAPITVTLTVTGCSTVNAPTVDASTQTICDGEAFKAVTATGTGIKWYNSADPTVVIATTNAFTPTAAGVYQVTQTNGCESPATRVVVTVNPIPSVSINAVDPICVGNTVTLTADVTGGVYTSVSGNAIGANGVFTPTTAGSTEIKYSVTQNGCVGSDNITITVNAAPATPVAADVADACGSANVTLSATGSDLVWTNAVGAVVNANLTGLSAGSYKYYVVSSIGSCSSGKDSVMFTVNAVPSKPVAQTEYIYQLGATINALTAAGSNLKWYNSAGTEVGTGASFNTGVANNAEASFTFTVTQTVNGCESTPETIVINVTNCLTPAPTLQGDEVCEGETGTLRAVSGSNVKWYNAAGVEVATTTNYMTSVAGTYYATQNIGCESAKASAVLTVNSKPTAPVISNKTIVEGAAIPTFVFASQTNVYNENKVFIATSNTFTPNVSNVEGTYVFFADVTSAKGCISAMNSFSLIIEPVVISKPNPPSASNVSVCQGENAVLTATGLSNATYKWYKDGSVIGTTQSYIVNLAGTYQVTQTVNSLESNPTDVVVTINPVPAAPTVSGATVCEGTTGILSAIGTGIIWYKGSTFVVRSSSFAPTQAGTYSATQTVNGCESPASDAVYAIKPLPGAPNLVQSTITVCNGDQVTLAIQGDARWYDGASLVQSGPTYNPSTSTAGVKTYTVSQVVAGCEGTAKSTATVTVNQKPTITDVADQVVMVGTPNTAMTAQASAGIISWYTSTPVTNPIATGNSYVATQTTKGVYTYYVEANNNGCKSATRSVVTTITDCALAAPTLDRTEIEICEGSPIGNITATATNNVTWFDVTGAQVASGNTFAPGALTAGTHTFSASQSSTCESPRSYVSITVNAAPVVYLSGPSRVLVADASQTISISPLGGSLTGPGIAGSKFYPSTVGIGTYVITYTFTDLATGCSTTKTHTIVVSNPVDKSILDALIVQSQAEISDPTISVGDGVGQYTQAAIAAYEEAINDAIAVNLNPDATQDEVDAAVIALTAAQDAFVTNVAADKAELIALITKAQSIVDTATIGNNVGEYTQAKKDALTAAIATANDVKNQNLSVVKQSVVDAAVVALENAIKAFTPVTEPTVTDIFFATDVLKVTVGESMTLSYSVRPVSAQSTPVTWTSSDPSIVSVDSKGKITVLKEGVAVIKVTVKSNSKFAEITINGVVDQAEIGAEPIVVYPSIVEDVVTVKGGAQIDRISIISSEGKNAANIKVNSDVIFIDLSGVASGSYTVVISKTDGSVESKVIIKK